MADKKNPNPYDKFDMVKREHVMIAGPMKYAVYKVRDPETMEWSDPQFHFTYDNIVMAKMAGSSAKMFSTLVRDYYYGEYPHERAEATMAAVRAARVIMNEAKKSGKNYRISAEHIDALKEAFEKADAA